MKERKVRAYGRYFVDFMTKLNKGAVNKISRVIDMLKTEDRIPEKFVKHVREGVFEIRAEWEGNIYRVFFCFDDGNIVILFNGFQKKTQKTPDKEIKKAIQLKKEYYESK